MRLSSIFVAVSLSGCVSSAITSPHNVTLHAHELALGASANETLCMYEKPLMLGPASTNTMTGCISYNKGVMASIRNNYGIEAEVAIWAHELGHVEQFKRDGPSPTLPLDRKPLEQEADEYAGCTLARLNMSPYPVFNWLKSKDFSDHIYGSLEERQEAFLRGMDRCSVIIMDNQEAFDKVSKHLIPMKKRSFGTETCAYNGPDDAHCAIGILLVGLPISKVENERGILTLLKDRPDVKERLAGISINLLEDLQNIHDGLVSWSVDDGFINTAGLEATANRWNLVFNK